MPADTAEFERLLERVLGFQRDESHHHLFKLYVNGKIVAMTKTSHSPKFHTIDDGLLGKIARRDLHVSLRFLKDMLAGRAGREDYLAELLKKGLPQPA